MSEDRDLRAPLDSDYDSLDELGRRLTSEAVVAVTSSRQRRMPYLR